MSKAKKAVSLGYLPLGPLPKRKYALDLDKVLLEILKDKKLLNEKTEQLRFERVKDHGYGDAWTASHVKSYEVRLFNSNDMNVTHFVEGTKHKAFSSKPRTDSDYYARLRGAELQAKDAKKRLEQLVAGDGNLVRVYTQPWRDYRNYGKHKSFIVITELVMDVDEYVKSSDVQTTVWGARQPRHNWLVCLQHPFSRPDSSKGRGDPMEPMLLTVIERFSDLASAENKAISLNGLVTRRTNKKNKSKSFTLKKVGDKTSLPKPKLHRDDPTTYFAVGDFVIFGKKKNLIYRVKDEKHTVSTATGFKERIVVRLQCVFAGMDTQYVGKMVSISNGIGNSYPYNDLLSADCKPIDPALIVAVHAELQQVVEQFVKHSFMGDIGQECSTENQAQKQ